MTEQVSLFQIGDFVLHSGARSNLKIDCDALSDSDIETLAVLITLNSPRFGSVEGVYRGGIRLATALRRFRTFGPLLIVDDVLTTGGSMENQRGGRAAIGAVIFARGPCPAWVRPLFVFAPAAWEPPS